MYAQVTAVGRPTKDLEFRTSAKTGELYTQFDLAVNEGYGDNAAASFYQCWLNGSEAVRAQKAGMKKGSLVMVSGDLSIRKGASKTAGNPYTVVRISGAKWFFVPVGNGASAANPGTTPNPAPAPGAAAVPDASGFPVASLDEEPEDLPLKKLIRRRPAKPGENELLQAGLMEQVRGRIDDALAMAEPSAGWEWVESDPLSRVLAKGSARICLSGLEEYQYAEVSFRDPSRLDIQLIQTKALELRPLHKAAAPAESQKETPELPASAAAPVESIEPAGPRESDVKAWYSLIGRQCLTDLITELNIQRKSRLVIAENGDIYTLSADSTLHKEKTLDHMPPVKCWDELIELLKEDELNAQMMDGRLAVTWKE